MHDTGILFDSVVSTNNVEILTATVFWSHHSHSLGAEPEAVEGVVEGGLTVPKALHLETSVNVSTGEEDVRHLGAHLDSEVPVHGDTSRRWVLG